MSTAAPFAFHILRESSLDTKLVVRFEVLDGGMGVLGLRKPGRVDPAPAMHAEESGVAVDHLRAGRFVHVVSSGARQSFALSRVTEELVQKIEADEWVTLDAITEYGFRYLVPPDEVAGRVEGGAAVQLQPMKESSIGDALGGVTSLLKAPRPKSVASASETGTPTAARREAEPEPASETPETPAAPQAAAADPAPQVPVSPSIADAALEGLDTDALRAHLREEMAKVDTLQTRVTALQKALDESQAREKDLLDVLAKWQSRA